MIFIIVNRSYYLLILLMEGGGFSARQVQNRPYIDQRIWHYGFLAGIHGSGLPQWLPLKAGVVGLFVPEYSPGFSVGVLGELYLNKYMAPA